MSKLCIRGHDSPRRANGNCIQCESERYKTTPSKRAYARKRSAAKWAGIKADPAKLEAHRVYMRQYAELNRERFNERNREDYSKRRVAIQLQRKKILHTPELIEAIENHNEFCDICSGPADGRWARLSIDHDHSTGQARGLLCTKCNKGLGYFQDNPELMKRAIAYLSEPPLASFQ